MRIYYASMDSANTSLMPGSKIWYYNLFLTLNKRFEVLRPNFSVQDQHLITVQNDRGPKDTKERYRRVFSEKLLDDVKKHHAEKKIDLFFSYFYNEAVDPEAIVQIKKLGIPTVNFYCNSIHQFFNVEEIAPYFDYSMFPEKNAYDKYKKSGANPIHIQMAANPDIYKPYNLKRIYDVTFVGQNYMKRKEYVLYLFSHGIDVKVWGPNWAKRTFAPDELLKSTKILERARRKFGLYKSSLPTRNIGGALSDIELIKMYSRTKVNLNFSEVMLQDDDDEKGEIRRHIRLRDFEAPMSRALYFTGYQEEVSEYYKIDKEVVCYDTEEELLDKVKFYLANESAAEKVREAGYQRALKDHTWDNRFRDLFKKIGLKYD